MPQGTEEKRRWRTGSLRYMVLGSRLAMLPAFWWGVIGFRGSSGTQYLKNLLGCGTVGAAALVALVLTAISAVAIWPYSADRSTLAGMDCR